jgi:GT2 family glycosyltransferase
MARVGLVTVLYKSNEVLEGFFKSLSAQSFQNYQLYLIDNSPSAETDILITQLALKYPLPGYTHIKNADNFGVAKGNNQGIELALGNGAEFVVLLNNDIDFTQVDLLDKLLTCAVEKSEDIIVPKILYAGTRKIWLAGGEFIHYKGTSRTIGDKQEDAPQYNQAGYTDYAPTCFMLLSKKVFEKVGLMDEQYFVYYDDNDFVIRAKNIGFKIYYLPQAEVFHKVSFSTGGSESEFSIYYLNRNRIYFIRKHYTFPVKQIALSHTVLTKSIRYLTYNSGRRQALWRAFKDGFSMHIKP